MLPNHPPTDPLMLYMPLAVRLSNLGNILIFYYSMCNTLNRSGFSSSLLKKMEIVHTTKFRESEYGWPPKLDAHLEVVEGLLTGD